MTKHIIIGSGPAALSAVEAIRRLSKTDEIKVVSREDSLPYSPAGLPYLLAGRTSEAEFFPKGAEYFEKQRVTFGRGQEATRIVAGKKQVVYRSGEAESYDRLLIACGATPAGGPGGNGVLAFHTLADCRRLTSIAGPAAEISVLGAGMVAVELSVALAERGARTRIIGRGRPLRAYFDEKPGAMIARVLTEHGIDIRTGKVITAVRKSGNGTQVVCGDGEVFEADAVVSCMGVKPRLDLIEGSGIAVNQGILVDRRMRTNVDGIYAAGDVAEAPSFADGRPGVSAILPNAIAQGAVAGANMAGGDDEYEGWLPMNLLKFYGNSAFSIGAATPGEADPLEMNDEASRRFKRLVFRDDRLIGAMFVNVAVDPGVISYLIRRRVNVWKRQSALFEQPLEVGRWLMLANERGKA